MKLSNRKVTTDILLLASIVDRLSIMVWKDTKDGQKGRNRPKSIVESLLSKEINDGQYQSFSDFEEFEKARARILGEK